MKLEVPIKVKVNGKGVVYNKDGTIKTDNKEEKVNGNVDNRRS